MDYKVTDTELIALADAIRAKGGTQADLEWSNGFISAVNDISAGSGYMPVPTATKQITENGTYDVINYASAVVNVSGSTSNIVSPAFQGLSYCYVPASGTSFCSYSQKSNYINIFEVVAGHKYALFVGESVGLRRRATFFSNKNYYDFEPYLNSETAEQTVIYEHSVWLAPFQQNTDDTGNALAGRIIYTPNSNGVIVYVTDNQSRECPAYCVDIT